MTTSRQEAGSRRRLDVGKGPKARQHLQQGYNLLFIYFLLFALWFNGHKKRGKSECGVHKKEKTKRNHNARCEFQCTHTHSYKYTRTLLAPRAYTQYRRFRTHMFFIPHPCVGLSDFFFINLYYTCAELSHCLNVRLRGDLAASIICNWNMALCLLYAQPLSAIKYATHFDLSCALMYPPCIPTHILIHKHTHA